MSNTDDFWGEPISVYTRAQAIEDGCLVDVSEMAREAGFKIPVALTRAAWENFVAWNDEDTKRKRWPQDEKGRLWDVLWMAFCAARAPMNKGKSEILYRFVRVPRDGRGVKPRPVFAKMHIGPGDNGEPAITIMLPGED